MNWAALVLNTGGYPETGYVDLMKIVLGVGLILWAGFKLVRWSRAEKEGVK